MQYIDIDIDIKYTNQDGLSIKDIIIALESAEKLLHSTKPFIQALDGDYILQDMQVLFNRLETGSLYETFKTRLFYGTKERQQLAHNGLCQFVENSNMKNIIIWGLAGIVGAGAMMAYNSESQPQAQASTHIEAYNSTVLNFGDNTTLSKEQVIAILEKLPNKKQIAQNAVKFISPAKKDPNAEIKIGNDTENPIVINKGMVAETPKKYESPMPVEKQEKYENIWVDIFALDVDKRNKWIGSIAGVTEARLKLSFDEDINVQELPRLGFNADVTLISKYNAKTKKYSPNSIHIEVVRQ